MPNVIRNRRLPRRAFLRGIGAAIALPWLDAMSPALARASREPSHPTRALFVFVPNGIKMDAWRPAQEGSGYTMPATLAPLAALREHFMVLSGLDLDVARAHGDGPGDHARAAASFLTCAHPVKTGGADIRVGTSIDQVIAAARGGQTRFRSLELGMEGGRSAGVCDSGYSCAYSHNVSWRTPTTPVAKETNPASAFHRLFGDPADHDHEARRRRRQSLRSVLDTVRGDVRSLNGRLSPSDRAKLDEYLTAVRELELRLAQVEDEESQQVQIEVPEHLEHPRGYRDRLALMYELIALAFQADATRTISFMVGNAGSNRSYPFLGIRDGHHYLSHHRGDASKHEKIGVINHFHAEQFARLLQTLHERDEGGESLLHRSMIVYGSGIADGNSHAHLDLPILLAGHGNGTLRPGRHLVYRRGTPLANLYLAMLDRLGVTADRHGDSTGKLGRLGQA